MRSFSIIKQTVRLSLQNIKCNKMRTFLTTLGIVIGVANIIAMITVMHCESVHAEEEFNKNGGTMISISITGSRYKNSLNENDIEKIRQIDNVEGVTPYIEIKATCAKDGFLWNKIELYGKNEFEYIYNDKIRKGRPLIRADVKNASYVCVIDETFQKNVFKELDPVGSELILNGIRYTVVGVEKDDEVERGELRRDNGRVTIPYTTALKLSGNSGITTVKVYASSIDTVDIVSDQLKDFLNTTFGNKESYSLLSMKSMLKYTQNLLANISKVAGGIAAISLLVGGIGIMNMMLVSVTERTKEIGLRKSLGATPVRIQMQFMLEAVVLSLMGGIMGTILGNAVALIFVKALQYRFSVSFQAIIIAVGFSSSVGIIFGWAPAKKASKLSPIDALRSE